MDPWRTAVGYYYRYLSTVESVIADYSALSTLPVGTLPDSVLSIPYPPAQKVTWVTDPEGQ